MKFGKIKRKNIAGQSYPSIWGNFGHTGETLDSMLLCTNNAPWMISFYVIYDEQHANGNCRQVADSNSIGFNVTLNIMNHTRQEYGGIMLTTF